MRTLDRQRLSPTREQLADALREAVEFANARVRCQFLPWPLPDLDATLARYAADAGGAQRWSCRDETLMGTGQAWAEAACAWWSDRLGRKHVRLLATRCMFPSSAGEMFPSLWEATPLAYVAPRCVARVERGGEQKFVAFCDCGVHGAPESLGWMGDCCGPCHDRREVGIAPADWSPWSLPVEGESVQLLFPAGGGFLVCSGDRVRLWDLDRREVVLEDAYPLHSLGPRPVCSPDGRWLAIATRERTFVVWDLRTGCRHAQAEQPGMGPREWLTGVTFLPDGRHLALLSFRTFSLWALDNDGMHAVSEFEADAQEARSLAVTPDGRALLVGTRRGVVRRWDLATWQVSEWSLDGPFGVTYMAGVDRTLVVADVHQAQVRVCDLDTGEVRAEFKGYLEYTSTPDRRTFVTFGGDGSLVFHDMTSGRVRGRLRLAAPDHYLEVFRGLAISPDGRLLAVGRGDGHVRFYPMELLELSH